MSRDDDYLWDRSGAPDPEVVRLERVLAPLRRDARPFAPPPRRLPRWPLAAVAAALLVAAALPFALRDRTATPAPDVGALPPTTAPSGPPLRVEGTGEVLAAGSWVEAGGREHELVLGDVGRIRLEAGSRLRVLRLADEATLLYLARGRLEATVSADARPRFFQVDTDAARCVDLGCRYTLSVDAAGVAHVAVTTGQVAFEAGDREVYVPAGAECSARPGAGPGTPRFGGAREDVASAFDAFDAAPRDDAARRRELALAALAAVRVERDTLPAWHLLQDPDLAVADAAVARLDEVTAGCAIASLPSPARRPGERGAWKEFLAARCW